jgi:hypothetical protein
MAPHSRRAVDRHHLQKAGVRLVVITDSASSPMARMASEAIIVPNKGASFFDTLLPAFLVAEILAALMAATAKINIKSQIADTRENSGAWANGGAARARKPPRWNRARLRPPATDDAAPEEAAAQKALPERRMPETCDGQQARQKAFSTPLILRIDGAWLQKGFP